MRQKCIMIAICIIVFMGMVLLRVQYQNGQQQPKDYGESEDLQDGTLYNVWITEGQEQTVIAMVDGELCQFDLKKRIDPLTCVVADLELEDGVVQKITLKEDTISGKVLSISKDTIEIDGYGELPIGTGYKVYKIYGELKQCSRADVLVGYDTADFVVADGKVCATLMKEKGSMENIRVLLKTNQYKDMYHEQVILTADCGFIVTKGKSSKSYKKGEKVTIKPDKESFGGQKRIKVTTEDSEGKIEILSLKRSYGNPSYRGSMEVCWKKGEGLLLINELSLENYLYAVIGSEMPVSYGEEALKVQAVCARSYAYKQLIYNGCGEYGAHVDDSVSYQVYNNVEETKETIAAVDKTKGQVMEYEGEVITAYYFSTSCGYTASSEEVWQGENADYLNGQIQSEKEKTMDLSKESTFASFICNSDFDSYDKEFPWYRWKVTVSGKELGAQIDEHIEERYEKNGDMILTKQKDDSFISKPIKTVGNVTGIRVLDRGKSGVLKSIIITGTKATIKVSTEYNIRVLLGPANETIYRADDSQIEGLDMLPSGFFMVEKEEDAFTFTGGGYGHGVGMSQNGAKAMADEGYTYEEILSHYYIDSEIANLPDQ